MRYSNIQQRLGSLQSLTRSIPAHTTVRERIILATLITVLVVSATLSIRGYINRNSHLVPSYGGSYSVALVGQPRHLNPIVAGANDVDLDINQLVYSSLFRVGEDLKLKNDLATGYEISEDNKEYTINLRKDVTWHDGEPFTADDVVFTIRSIQTPEYASPLQSAFRSEGVEIEKIDDHTVKFTLKEKPYAPFLYSLTVHIAPKHVWENIAPNNVALAEQILKPIGTGPFAFEEISTRRRTGEVTKFKIARNQSYYGKRPYIESITLHFLPTHDEAIEALKTGNVQGIGFLPASQVREVENRGALSVQKLALPQYTALLFNMSNDILQDNNVRSAIALAIDRNPFIENVLQGKGDAIYTPLPDGLFSFSETFDTPPYDKEQAKNILEEAGWTMGDDGIRAKDDKKLQFTVTTTDWPEYAQSAEIIKDQLKPLGIDIEIQTMSAGIINQTVIAPRDYEILLYGKNLLANPDPYPFWHSDQSQSPGLNLSILEDDDIDSLLERAREEHNMEERHKLLIEFQERFLELHPAVILYRPYYLFARHRDVGGEVMPYGNLPSNQYNNIEQWYVQTKRVWNSN